MTVKELIERLSRFKEDMRVVCDDYYDYDIEDVQQENGKVIIY